MSDQTRSTTPDEETMRHYLLNDLPDQKRQELEQRLLTDQDLFETMQAVEWELFGDYVRLKRSGQRPDWMAQFEKHYLATPERRARVKFAEELITVSLEAVEKSLPKAALAAPVAARLETGRQEEMIPWWKFWQLPPRWGLAVAMSAAAVVLLVLGGVLFVQNQQLRRQLDQSQSRRTELEQREREIQQQIAQQRGENSQLKEDLENVRKELDRIKAGAPEERGIVAQLIFSPRSKGIGGTDTSRTLKVPGDAAGQVKLGVVINTDEYSTFRATLKETSGGKVILNRTNLKATSSSSGLAVSVVIPASQLMAKEYSLTLTGVRPTGEAVEIGKYSFKVERN